MLYQLEFSLTSTGCVMVREGNDLHALKDSDRDIVSFIVGQIRVNYPEAYDALEKMYSKSKANRRYMEYLMADRFIRCNMSSDDLLSLDVNSGHLNLEYVSCPLRGGACPHEKIICCPKAFAYSGLTDIERRTLVSFIRLRSQKEVGKLMGLSENTVKGYLRRIMQKKNAETIQDLCDMYLRI